ncbi:hypothetical protein MSG28_005135 [Choristoneura fumiferana]|uniref:Uncharacterized protein n=1 Tax=Choristoneura fumiferana TaxID=7141 RepID=A0ACC0JPW5_CHOFU|nr:hypothetical protein MSG28_005135 [Choristoneura fumiferana]
MEFIDAVPVTFKEITPTSNVPEKWKEVVLNTGKQTTSDAIELSEASLDINLTSSNLRCKVAPGTPPLSGMSVYERTASQDIVILAATVSSVHRLIFPHPESIDKKYSSPTSGVAHTCASLLLDNGEAVFALAFGFGGDGGLLLVKLPIAGSAVTTLLKRESAVPRFLSGITGALRGKNVDSIETYGVVLTNGLAIAICGDACLRAWAINDGGAPAVVTPPLSQTLVRPKPPPHGHMLQKTIGSNGGVTLVAYLSFPNECEFVVMKMLDAGGGAVKFSHVCRIFGPQLDLLDYTIGYGDDNDVIWALWSQPDGDTIITSAGRICTVGVCSTWKVYRSHWNAVLELNDALRLDVPEIDTTKNEEEDQSEYESLFASDLGVSINYVTMLEPWCEWNACSRQFILGLSLLDLSDAEGAYTAFCKAAKGVSTEPFLRQLVAAPDARLTQHQALVLYYMKAERAAAARAKLHDAHADNPYYDFLYALHISRHHYRKGCVRALLAGGRVAEAADACAGALRGALVALAPHAPPAAAPLAVADLLLAELRAAPRPHYTEIYEELDQLVKEYTEVVVRTSEDMKLAHLNYSVVNLENRELQQKYQDVILDFGYFRIADNQEKKINANVLAVYTTPEHQASALATQASMLVVCLFFMPQYLHSDVSKMREIADKFFPSNWIIPIYMGVTVNVIDYWENFKAAKLALSNTCNSKMVKEVFSKRGSAVPMLINKTHQLLKEGVMTDDFVLDNINKILNLLINSNFVLRWLLLHNSHVIFYDTNKKSKQLKELVLKESGYDPLKILELLISTAELELKVREMLNRLLENRNESWNTSKTEALEALNNLAELFSGDKSFTKVKENDQLKQWFTNIANQIKSVGESITTKSMKKITQLIQALDEVEEFHGIKSASTVLQFLSESKDALKNALRAASLKEDSLVTLEIAADTWTIKEIPTRLDKERLKEFAQLEQRMEVAKLTHSASTFTTGILDMRSTLVGVIRVDPAELLEDGLLKELDTHISKKFVEFLEPQSRKPLAPNTLLIRLQKLAESMDGYKRSLEYIQDYINIHGLRIWQKQVSAIIVESVAKEISLRKGVTLYSPSAGFMGSLARQIAQLTDARVCSYINICTAWFDIKSQTEIVNTKTFAKLNEAIGVVGLHGLDTLYAFMIKNQLQTVQQIFKSGQDKINVSNLNVDVKDIELAITKGQKVLQQLADVIVLIGTLQVLRRHIAYQLNSTAKSLLNELKINPESNPKVTAELLKYLEDYLVRCGIYEPFEKIYIRNAAEFSIVDMGRVCAILLISQLTKMQFCQTTGDLISRKAGENIDGYPFLVGIYTLLRQVGRDNIETFVSFLSAYMKNATLSKSKSSEVSYEGACIGRVIIHKLKKRNMEVVEEHLGHNSVAEEVQISASNETVGTAEDAGVSHKSNGVAELDATANLDLAATEDCAAPDLVNVDSTASHNVTSLVMMKSCESATTVSENPSAVESEVVDSTTDTVNHQDIEIQPDNEPTSRIDEEISELFVESTETVVTHSDLPVSEECLIDNAEPNDAVQFKTEILVERNENDVNETDQTGVNSEVLDSSKHILSELRQNLELSDVLHSEVDNMENNNGSTREEVLNKEELLDILEGNDVEQADDQYVKIIQADHSNIKTVEAQMALKQLTRLKSTSKQRRSFERLPRKKKGDKKFSQNNSSTTETKLKTEKASEVSADESETSLEQSKGKKDKKIVGVAGYVSDSKISKKDKKQSEMTSGGEEVVPVESAKSKKEKQTSVTRTDETESLQLDTKSKRNRKAVDTSSKVSENPSLENKAKKDNTVTSKGNAEVSQNNDILESESNKPNNIKENIVNVLVRDWEDDDHEPLKDVATEKHLEETENLVNSTEQLTVAQEVVVDHEPIDGSSMDSSASFVSEGQAMANKSGDESQPQRRLGRVIKKKVIFDPDNPDTFTKGKLTNKNKETSDKEQPTPKRSKIEVQQMPKAKSPPGKLHWKKPPPKASKQNKRLTEVDRLLMDEGAVNMIYQLTPEAPKGKKNMRTKAEFIKKIQSSTPETKEMKFRERKKESIKGEEAEAKKIAGGKQRGSLSSSVKSISVCEDFEAHSADDSIIYRRHSSSSYSSNCMSPLRVNELDSNGAPGAARVSRQPSDTQNISIADEESVSQISDVFMLDVNATSPNEVINKTDCLSIKQKLNSKLSHVLSKRKRESMKTDKPAKQKRVSAKHDERKEIIVKNEVATGLSKLKTLTVTFDNNLAEISVKRKEDQQQYNIQLDSLVVFGHQLSAAEALAGGLLSRVLWPLRIEKQLRELARDIASRPSRRRRRAQRHSRTSAGARQYRCSTAAHAWRAAHRGRLRSLSSCQGLLLKKQLLTLDRGEKTFQSCLEVERDLLADYWVLLLMYPKLYI